MYSVTYFFNIMLRIFKNIGIRFNCGGTKYTSFPEKQKVKLDLFLSGY